jgi:Sulfatase
VIASLLGGSGWASIVIRSAGEGDVRTDSKAKSANSVAAYQHYKAVRHASMIFDLTPTVFKDSDPAAFPQGMKAPAGAPNVLLVQLDDVGFGQFSVSGSGVPVSNTEKPANNLFYNRFHTTALCQPSRAALLTGRNHSNRRRA